MPARFTPDARYVIETSQAEALRLGHGSIRTEHILLALIHEEAGEAGEVLRSLGVTARAARLLAEELGGADQNTLGRTLPFTPRVRKVLEGSLREATDHGHERISAAHLLLALFHEDVRGGHDLLTQLGVDPSQVRSQVEAALASPPAGP
ncbi:Clp amino terminal domain-containing protein [Frankia sp. EI5c]|uniref:Clp protease N-terminal domain-containing protein n=1 Tax=Frankia sp. EI5c TaxID=683316 RepID=UPI0007C2695B|nr:Clp protease N-terminal domain-containing protein [Frankia sp. EI5c]OAA19851.1 Clp amino terminal domain-containing protein [Frankia sp. EI5c]